MIKTLASIAVFGSLGCWARYGQTIFMQGLFGRGFPVAVLSINVLGSFAIGFLFVLTAERVAIDPALRTGILTGFLGGYTTFSTFELESLMLVESGEIAKAGLYVLLSVVLGFIGAFLGVYLARNV
ncbi:MAG TPA: fluoride efflux transporter CrcB [Acidiphilium sp.]|uniref:fluoride efflux transporter CrcB n=1 Tax=unclassified Acidiphilium TaxID=2617493 RepID=UPI000BD9D982|nr:MULTISPECIES: fluoride efflux transporter CrcB [unclassified Acidiphilium]OYV57719.1 MAG: camphor resistance protein CrcB [Acidiphilium sp. 20-67-58]HQT60021.1 fluoride efflux transporter CrcB [Acidiphilium sp.]HQU12513.1 fluoride efflux transporter CrcB [Acidiphilium sp.]